MRDLRVNERFLSQGGSELAPMSATSDLSVAVQYARSDVGGSQGGTDGDSFNGSSFRRSNASLLFRIQAHSFMEHGANLAFLSIFPQEAEYCYPPMTYLRPTGRLHTVVFDSVRYTVVDVQPHFPS